MSEATVQKLANVLAAYSEVLGMQALNMQRADAGAPWHVPVYGDERIWRAVAGSV